MDKISDCKYCRGVKIDHYWEDCICKTKKEDS